ncbi:MAG: crossover junction endodeoxyribonuclease RuvC [Firmicutes bacterium]|nr:crossover junction endodeoxyribonuclease RuvC [Bacillota bacterium]
MRILGIDPGYAIMGYGVVEKKGNSLTLVTAGAVTTPKEMIMSDRLKTLYQGLMDVIAEYQPEEVAIEELYFNTNAKTVIFVGEARGVAILACSNSGLPIFEYTPLQIKTSMTGNGRADQKQVQFMVKRILKLDDIIRPDDAADAVAAAITHANTGEVRKKMMQRQDI